jgi:hypothetical protein
MHRLICIGTEALKEILGLVPSNPRRNTSGTLFEVLRRGDKAETCIRFVSSLYPLLGTSSKKADTKWRQRGSMSSLSNHLCSMNG